MWTLLLGWQSMSLRTNLRPRYQIEGKLVTLQAVQQKLQVDSTRELAKKTVGDVKQETTQCTTEVVVIWVELEGLCTKISVPTK